MHVLKRRGLFFLGCTVMLAMGGNTLGYCSPDSEKKNKINETETEVILNSSVGLGGSAAPIVLLADTIQKNKSSNRFRLNWDFAIASQAGWSTAFYERKTGTVKLYSLLEDTGGKRETNYLYTGITDDIIVRLAEKYRADEVIITDLSFFNHLPNGKDLGTTYVSYEQKDKVVNKKRGKTSNLPRKKQRKQSR